MGHPADRPDPPRQALAWLLEPGNPPVRYRALVELLGPAEGTRR